MFEYSEVVNKLRNFFMSRGYIEVHVQSRRSILAACEDPYTVSKFEFGGEVWPLPQTGQMWLEYELLKNPKVPGVFCVSTSYRDEPNPIPGRHDTIFPLVEFECLGTVRELMELEQDALTWLGLGTAVQIGYEEAAMKYDVSTLEAEHETQMLEDLGPAVMLTDFPLRTHPFWNMKQHPGDDHFAKVDVILAGIETIGSAERSTNVEEMRRNFYHISEGGYAAKLFELFGKERVERELDEFLAHPMTPRFGGAFGVTRLIRAMKMAGVLEAAKAPDAALV